MIANAQTPLSSPEPITLIHFLLSEYALYKPVSKGTIEQLQYAISRFDKYLGRESTLDDLKDETVSNFLVWCEHTMKYMPKTIKNTRGAILSIWNYAFDEFHVPAKHQRIRKIKVSLPNPKAWDFQEVSLWMEGAAIFADQTYANGIRKTDWWQCFGALAYESAMRGCDLMDLEFNSIDHRQMVSIIQKKTGDAQVVQLSDNCMHFINKIRDPERRVILDFPHSDKHFYDEFYRINEAVGLKGQPKYFRRSAATHAENAQPGAAKKILGHRTHGLAEKHYIDRRQQETTTVPVPIPIPAGEIPIAGPALPC